MLQEACLDFGSHVRPEMDKDRKRVMAVMAKKFCLDARSRVRCLKAWGYSGLLCLWWVKGGCWGRSSCSNCSFTVAMCLLSISTTPHCSLCWQQSPSPSRSGLGKCVMAVVTHWLLRAHCHGVPAFAPMIPAVAAVPGFSSASGDAQYLTPKASRSSVGYWTLRRVLLDL